MQSVTLTSCTPPKSAFTIVGVPKLTTSLTKRESMEECTEGSHSLNCSPVRKPLASSIPPPPPMLLQHSVSSGGGGSSTARSSNCSTSFTNQQQHQQNQILTSPALVGISAHGIQPSRQVLLGKETETLFNETASKRSKIIELQSVPEELCNAPLFIQLVGSLLTHAAIGENRQFDSVYQIAVSEGAWRQLVYVVNRKLFRFENMRDEALFTEVAQLLVFRPEVAERMAPVLRGGRGNLVSLENLVQFHNALAAGEGTEAMAFAVYSQNVFTIAREHFEIIFQKLQQIVNAYFERANNVIVSFIKRNARLRLKLAQDELLEAYLKLMGNFKQTNLSDFVRQLCEDIFIVPQQASPNTANHHFLQSVEKRIFLQNVRALHEKTNSTLLYTLLDIIRIEFQLCLQEEFCAQLLTLPGMHQPTLKQPSALPSIANNQLTMNLQQVSSQKSISSPTSSSAIDDDKQQKQNYYLKTIDKLLNKCVFNGDFKCNCKKCQCIRRNRNSAKESQKRKRDALLQIGPLQEKYDEMVKKCNQLEGENRYFKEVIETILKKVKSEEEVQPYMQEVQQYCQDLFNISI